MVEKLRVLTMVAAACALTACGGSGDSDSDAASAEGAYAGTISNGGSFATVILEDGTFYAPFSAGADGGLLYGKGSSNGSQFTVTNGLDFRYTGQQVPLQVSATYTAGESLRGTFTEGDATATFTASAYPASVYDYNAAARLADVEGTWSLASLGVQVSVSAQGAFSAVIGSCAVGGSLQPRASGKNVFNLAMAFGPSCVLNGVDLSGQQLSGIALRVVPQDQAAQLALAALNSNSTAMFLATATR